MSEIDPKETIQPLERVGDPPRPTLTSPDLSLTSILRSQTRLTTTPVDAPRPADKVTIPTLTLHDSRVNRGSEYSVDSGPAKTYSDNRSTVVRINTADSFGDGNGTGFVVAQDGLIATGYHVVKGANSIHVRMENGKVYKAKVFDLDPAKDLALLMVEKENPNEKFQAAKLDNNSDRAVEDRKLVALGYPGGVDKIHLSEVKTKARQKLSNLPVVGGYLEGEDPSRIVVRTEGNVLRGNSGGPVFDPDTGKVVGVINLSNQVDTYFNPVEDLLSFLAKPRHREPSAAVRAATLDIGVKPAPKDGGLQVPSSTALVPRLNPYYTPELTPKIDLKAPIVLPQGTTPSGGLATRIQELGKR